VASVVALAVVIVGCTRGGSDVGATGDVGGRTCAGWATVEAVEAAIGMAVDDLDEIVVATPRPGQLDCFLHAADGTVMRLHVDRWPQFDFDHRTLDDLDDAVDAGVGEWSRIGPIGRDDDDPAVLGLARVPTDAVPAGEVGVSVVLLRPAADADTHEVIGRLLGELAAAAEDGPPDAT
jgi:hypothetical protein